MTELILGMLAAQLASSYVPQIVNGLIRVKSTERVNFDKAYRDALTVRPIIPYRAPAQYTGGRVRALFIGINYAGTRSRLNGCVNDVRQMLATLQRIAFPITECCILVDDPKFPNFTALPTRKNMIKYMAWLTTDIRPGDVLFLHYSGHGGQIRSKNDSEEAYDQCLIPLDYAKAGGIVDDDLFRLLVAPLPNGSRMTCVFDCCHSATMLDLPFSFVGGYGLSSHGTSHHMSAVRRNNFSHGDVVMFSGCEDSGTSADVHNTASFGAGSAGAGGAATQALTWALTNTQGLCYMDILLQTRDILRGKGYKQVPQLTSSKPIDLYKPFSLFGTITVDERMAKAYVPSEYTQYTPQPSFMGYDWPGTSQYQSFQGGYPSSASYPDPQCQPSALYPQPQYPYQAGDPQYRY